MEFMQRGGRPSQPVAPGSASATTAGDAKRSRSTNGQQGAMRIASIVLLASVAVLLLSLIGFLSTARVSGLNDGRLVDTTKYQAVFLNGGQVYFGHITALNNKSLHLNDIYYLRVNQQVQPGQQASSDDVSLVKLGCELHGPADQMFINREQITFWENLKEDGQVAKAVKQYQEQNKDGQKCDTPAQSNATTPTPAPAPAPTPTPSTTKKP